MMEVGRHVSPFLPNRRSGRLAPQQSRAAFPIHSAAASCPHFHILAVAQDGHSQCVRSQLRQLTARHGVWVDEGSFRRQSGGTAALVACRVPRGSNGAQQGEQPRQGPPGGRHVAAVGGTK